jgi:hypothetical protein
MKALLPIILLLSLVSPAKALNCGDLAKYYLDVASHNGNTTTLVSAYNIGYFLAFVSGYIAGDSGDRYSHFDIPPQVKGGQLAHVVGKYLQAHPEKWHLGMNQCVYDALRATWPNN